MLAPVVVFVYNRLDKTKNVLDSLNNNTLSNQTDLFIFSDGPKNSNNSQKVKDVRNCLYTFKNNNNFKSLKLIESDENRGLANSIIDGVTKIISEYGKVIVVEDDLICVDNFLEFMNDALDYYNDDENIWSISGYSYPLKSLIEYNNDVYYTYRGCSWGWATWKNRWSKTIWDLDYFDTLLFHPKKMFRLNRAGKDLYQMLYYQKKGRIDSWAVRWVYSQTQMEKYTVYPKQTFIFNNGLDGSGTHGVIENNNKYSSTKGHNYELKKVEINDEINKEFLGCYKEPFVNILKGVLTYPYRYIVNKIERKK